MLTPSLKLKFVSEDLVSIQSADASITESIPIETADMELALKYLKQLNRKCFNDGKRVSQHIVVDGFEPWWFSQEHLYWNILVPFTRYRRLIHRCLTSTSVEIVEPSYELSRLITILAGKANIPSLQITSKHTYQSQIGDFETALIRASVKSLLHYIVNRPEALIYTVDKVTKGLGYDFRLKAIYQELAQRNEKFAEYVHVGERNVVFDNLKQRQRPVVFFEYLAPLVDRLLSKVGRKKAKASLSIAVDANDKDDIFLAAVAAYGIQKAESSASCYRGLKLLLRLHQPKYAFIMDDSRHTHALAAACKALKIPTVGYQHGLNINKYFTGLACYGWSGARSHAPDTYGLWSEYYRDSLLSFSEFYTAQQTFICGNLRPPENKSLINFSVAPAKPQQQKSIKVLLISEPKAKPEELLPTVEKLVNSSQCSVALKLRPSENLVPVKELFGSLLENMEQVSTAGVYQAFAGADVVVGMYSSVLYEAVLAGKPVVIIKNSSPFAGNLAEQGLADLIVDCEQAEEIVIHASNLSQEELIRRRDVVWGKEQNDGASTLFQAVETLNANRYKN